MDKISSFKPHIKTICRNSGQNLSVVPRITSYTDTELKRMLRNSIIKFQFNYCQSFSIFW